MRAGRLTMVVPFVCLAEPRDDSPKSCAGAS